MNWRARTPEDAKLKDDDWPYKVLKQRKNRYDNFLDKISIRDIFLFLSMIIIFIIAFIHNRGIHELRIITIYANEDINKINKELDILKNINKDLISKTQDIDNANKKMEETFSSLEEENKRLKEQVNILSQKIQK